jgi:hypothetical protein
MLLFSCYEFLHEMHVRPASWLELMEFMNFSRVKNIFQEMAMKAAKIGKG